MPPRVGRDEGCTSTGERVGRGMLGAVAMRMAGDREPALWYGQWWPVGNVGGWGTDHLQTCSGESCAGSEVCPGERHPPCPQPLPGLQEKLQEVGGWLERCL